MDGMGGHSSDAQTQFLFTGILKRRTWLWHRLLIMWSQLLDFFWSTFCKLSMLLELKQLQETLVLRKARSLWFLYYAPPLGWEWPCVTDNSGSWPYGLMALGTEMEHPAYTPVGVWHTLPLPRVGGIKQ